MGGQYQSSFMKPCGASEIAGAKKEATRRRRPSRHEMRRVASAGSGAPSLFPRPPQGGCARGSDHHQPGPPRREPTRTVTWARSHQSHRLEPNRGPSDPQRRWDRHRVPLTRRGRCGLGARPRLSGRLGAWRRAALAAQAALGAGGQALRAAGTRELSGPLEGGRLSGEGPRAAPGAARGAGGWDSRALGAAGAGGGGSRGGEGAAGSRGGGQLGRSRAGGGRFQGWASAPPEGKLA